MKTQNIGIIGGGAWGLSLGLHYHRLGWLSGLFTRFSETVEFINNTNQTIKLKDTVFEANFPISCDLSPALKAHNILIAGTVKALPEHLERLVPYYHGQNIILCCKGQDHETFALPHEIAAKYLPTEKVFLLSGPSFAADIAASRAVAVCLAGENLTTTTALAQNLNTSLIRLYASNDRTGVAVGGAYKNVLAIAAGIARGLDIGSSAEAALITRGLSELLGLSAALGGETKTMFGLSGLGDLILSCNSIESRNFRFGFALGNGQSTAEAQQSVGAVVEGFATAKSLPQMLHLHKLDLPICSAVYDILFVGTAPRTALESLLNRPGGKIE